MVKLYRGLRWNQLDELIRIYKRCGAAEFIPAYISEVANTQRLSVFSQAKVIVSNRSLMSGVIKVWKISDAVLPWLISNYGRVDPALEQQSREFIEAYHQEKHQDKINRERLSRKRKRGVL